MVISNNQEPNPPLILPWGEVLLSTLLGTLGGHTECVKTFSSLKNLFFTLKNIKNYLRMIFFFFLLMSSRGSLDCCLKSTAVAKTSHTVDWFSVCTCKITLGLGESGFLIFTIAKARVNGSMPEKKKMKAGGDPSNCWRFSLSGKCFPVMKSWCQRQNLALQLPLCPHPQSSLFYIYSY